MHIQTHFLIGNSDISTGLIGYMDVMILLHEATDSASHGNDIIIRMGREDDNPFRIRQSTLRTSAVISIWFTSRPACNRMLKFIEHFDIDKASLSFELFDEMAQSIINIVFGGEFQKGLAHLFT